MTAVGATYPSTLLPQPRRRSTRRRGGAHIGQQVHGCLLHPGVGRGDNPVMVGIQSPRPLNGSRAEHECTARCLVHRHVMCCGSRRDGVPKILEVLAVPRPCRRQPDQPGWTKPIVQILVRLIADGMRRQCRARAGG